MNGSGTTMLLDCLGHHPALYAFPKETRLIPYLIARQGTYGDLNVDAHFERLWEDVRNLPVFRETNANMPVPIPTDWREGPRTLAAILDAVFSYFAAGQGKRRWCEKTPQHVQHLLALAELFPAARFVHVIRDGRDCAVSFHRRWLRQPELTIFRWKNVVNIGRQQGRQLGEGRYMEIRYEDLTAEPESSLRAICRFLGLPFAAATLESSRPYLQAGPADSERGLQRNSGNWQRYFSARTQDRLERIAGKALSECGYATRYPTSNADISSLERKYWAFMDIRRQYSREIKLKLSGQIQRPWRVILVKPLTALRQRQYNDY